MKTNELLIALALFSALLFTGCAPRARVGALQSESQSVELGDESSVRVEIAIGAGTLELTGGAQKLLEADFTYNVALLKPEVTHTDGTLTIQQPEARGLPIFQDITSFRNEWELHLTDDVPLDLHVDMGGGSSDLKLAGLSLTRLDIGLGAGTSTIDLSGDWESDLAVTISAGAANVSLQLPREVGARVEVESGPHTIVTTGLTKVGDAYTNAAYGESEVTLVVNLEAGIGQINLEVEEEVANRDN